MSATLLLSRAVIRLSPLDEAENVRDFLQGLVTNDVASALPIWTALLTPQGKVLFDFLIWADDKPNDQDLLIDCEANAAEALIKRLSLYRLRRKIAIALDEQLSVHWKPEADPALSNDPRLATLGTRWIAPAHPGEAAVDQSWHAHRLACGVAEGITELGNGELLWLECNAAELNGVSFTKGCYVGQENTARMNWRQKVNRRLLVVPLKQSNPAGQRIAYPDLGLAIDHLRTEDIADNLLPQWLHLSDQSPTE